MGQNSEKDEKRKRILRASDLERRAHGCPGRSTRTPRTERV